MHSSLDWIAAAMSIVAATCWFIASSKVSPGDFANKAHDSGVQEEIYAWAKRTGHWNMAAAIATGVAALFQALALAVR